MPTRELGRVRGLSPNRTHDAGMIAQRTIHPRMASSNTTALTQRRPANFAAHNGHGSALAFPGRAVDFGLWYGNPTVGQLESRSAAQYGAAPAMARAPPLRGWLHFARHDDLASTA